MEQDKKAKEDRRAEHAQKKVAKEAERAAKKKKKAEQEEVQACKKEEADRRRREAAVWTCALARAAACNAAPRTTLAGCGATTAPPSAFPAIARGAPAGWSSWPHSRRRSVRTGDPAADGARASATD